MVWNFDNGSAGRIILHQITKKPKVVDGEVHFSKKKLSNSATGLDKNAKKIPI